MSETKYLLTEVTNSNHVDDIDYDDALTKKELLEMLAADLDYDLQKKPTFTIIGVGDTWSDHQCNKCKKVFTVQMEDSDPTECYVCKEKEN